MSKKTKKNQPQPEPELEVIPFSELPPAQPELPETAYRRGYYDGFLVAVHLLSDRISPSLFRQLDDFIYFQLGDWLGRSYPELVRGVDRQWHYDSHHVTKREEPPRFE